MSTPNNVTRLLDAHRVKYAAFDLPEEKLSALETARLLNVEPELVFKTIVVRRDKPKKPLLVLVPAAFSVDLKLLAAAVGEKKVYLPTEREAEEMTGLQAGGISPLALLNRGFQVVLDSSVLHHNEIHISGGKRGLNLRLPVAALQQLTAARVHAVSRLTEDHAGQDDQPIPSP